MGFFRELPDNSQNDKNADFGELLNLFCPLQWLLGCWFSPELERCWFLENDYEIKTVFVMVNLDYENIYPTHAFLCYKNKDNNGWNYFENADFDNRGIHPFTSFNEVVKYQLSKYKEFLKTFNIKEEELDKIVIKVFSKPNEHSSAREYLDFVLSSIDMDI